MYYMREGEPNIEVRAAALKSEILSLRGSAVEQCGGGLDGLYNVGEQCLQSLVAAGYHNEYSERDRDPKQYVKNYYAYHALIGSTIDVPTDPAFLDFPGELSIVSQLRSMLGANETQ